MGKEEAVCVDREVSGRGEREILVGTEVGLWKVMTFSLHKSWG